MFGPVLEGDVVRLRPLRPTEEEAETMRLWFEDPVVTQWLNRIDPPSQEQELEWIRAKQLDQNCVNWGIELEGKLIGTGGAELIDWRHRHGTLGIVIGDRTAWRGGVASESGRLVLGDLFANLELDVLRAGYIDGNQASAGLQAKLGLQEVGRWPRAFMRQGHLRDHVLTAITRDEWESLYRPSSGGGGW